MYFWIEKPHFIDQNLGFRVQSGGIGPLSGHAGGVGPLLRTNAF
jgi:hypothetical protein